MRPIHDKLMAAIDAFGDFESVPKKGYVSLRRKKQFAMIGPASNTRVEVGLNMKGAEAAARLIEQRAGSMCNYIAKVTTVEEVDAELVGWINQSMNQPSAPGVTGNRGVIINGFCTTGVPNNPVTGNNVLVATVMFASCPAGSAGFVMDLDSGDDVFGASVVDFADSNNDAYYLSDADMTDGTLMCLVTAVTLANFTAVTRPDHVLVTWETVSELDNAGFNLYRDTSPAGPGVRVNRTLIPAQGPGGTGGFPYSWQDFDAPYGQSLYYWLEDVDFNGTTNREGPVSVELAEWTAVELDRFDAQTAAASWPPALVGLAALGAFAGGILTVRRLGRCRQAE